VFSYTTPSTSGIVEGTNLYFTDARARASISVTGAGSYNSTTGVINIVGGVTSFNTRTGAITLSSADVTGALGFTPYNATNPSGYLTGITSSQVTTALGFTPYNATNPSGYITGITSSNVTTALGFTPYNATNPSGYISGITSGMVTTALGYTPYNSSNPSGYITSSALSPYLPLAGGTITGPIYSPQYDNSSRIMFNSASTYYLGLTGNVSTSGGSLSMVQYNSASGALANVVNSYALLHSGNYNSYSPTLTGGNASGTWAISVSGNSATTSQRAFSGDVSTTGQGRFTGWYTGNAATGTAAEIGMSSGQGYIFVYNRDSGSYGTLNIAASSANLQFSGSTVNVSSGSLQQGGNQVLHAGNYTSYAATAGHNHTYDVNNAWLRDANDDANVKLYGNTRQMVFRTDGTTEFASGVGGYAFAWMYGGDSVSERRMLLASDGRLWTNYHGWLDTMSVAYASTAGSADAIDGVGFRNTGSNASTNADTIESNGITYYTAGVPNFTGNAADGALYSQAYNGNWQHQIAGDYRSGQIALRGKNNGTWQSWRTVVDSTNVSTYAHTISTNPNTAGPGTLAIGNNGSYSFVQSHAGQPLILNPVGNQVRVPILYDSDDTAWYVDLNGNSRLNQLGVGSNNTSYTFYNNGTSYLNGAVTIDDTVSLTAGNQLLFYTSANSLRGYINATDTDDNHLQIATSGGEDIVFKDGGLSGTRNLVIRGSNAGTEAYGSMRAPIFYDSNDTSYYVNPNAGSFFSSLAINGDFRTTFVSGSGGSTFGASHYSMGKDIANGSWSHPHYSDLIIGYHTGIRIGANYSGIRFYNNSPTTDANNDGNGDAGEALLMTIGGYIGTANHSDVYVNNHLFAGGSMRSPIFYDSNNTGFYVDPASRSRQSSIDFGSNGYYIHAGDWGMRNTTPDGWIQFGPANTSHAHIYTDRSNFYFNAQLQVNGGSQINTSDIRANIFYDQQDTSYYFDGTSTTRLNAALFVGPIGRTTSVAGWFQGTYNNVGDNSMKSNPIYTIGSSYNPSDTTLSNMYGIGYAHPNFWGSSRGSGWGMYTAAAGVFTGVFGAEGNGFNTWISGYGEATGSWRAPIFYDSNDTGYYLNPNGSSLLYGIVLSGNMYFRPNTWIQCDTSAGIYWPNHYNLHLYPNTTSSYTSFYIEGSKNSYSGAYLGHSAVNGMMYDSAGNGGVYREAQGRWYFYHNLSNNCMGVGSSATSSAFGIWVVKGGYFDGRVDATIHYDASDTGYYLDPNSTTALRTVGSWRADSAAWDGEFNGKLQYHSSNWYFQYAGNMLFRNSGGSNVFNVDQSGNTVASGNITAYSDVRIKENIVTIDSALNKVLNLRGVYYNKIGNPERRVGVIAQEIETVLPEVVRCISETNPSTGETQELLAVDYGNITGLLIEATKEQNQEIVDLRNRVAQLEALIEKLIKE
jgi:hypothetical protein